MCSILEYLQFGCKILSEVTYNCYVTYGERNKDLLVMHPIKSFRQILHCLPHEDKIIFEYIDIKYLNSSKGLTTTSSCSNLLVVLDLWPQLGAEFVAKQNGWVLCLILQKKFFAMFKWINAVAKWITWFLNESIFPSLTLLVGNWMGRSKIVIKWSLPLPFFFSNGFLKNFFGTVGMPPLCTFTAH